MKSAVLFLCLLCTPALYATSSIRPSKEEIALQDEQRKDDTKIKLAVIAALVTMWIAYKNGSVKDAVAFDQFIMWLMGK